MTSDIRLELKLFGSFFCKWSDGREISIPGAKHRALLAILATAANGTHSRAWLQEHLWALSGEEHGRASLRRALSDLRRIFDDRFDLVFDVSNIDICLRPAYVQVIGNAANGIFLDGLTIREPQFQEWLTQKRESGAAGSHRMLIDPHQSVSPTLAVIPFTPVSGGIETLHFGDLMALEVTRAITRSKMIDVISHLSCRQFTGKMLQLDEVRKNLEVDYLIHGSVRVDDGQFRLDADFVQASTSRIMWTRTFTGSLREVLAGDSDVARQIATQAGQAVLRASVELSRSVPLPQVESHALFMSSIAQMHQHHLATFASARKQLEELISRTPNHSVLHAWLAKWYILATSQGWSDDPARDTMIASDSTKRALDLDPFCATSLTVDGMIQGASGGNHAVANSRFIEATNINPNEALAWLMYSRMHLFLGQGREAVKYADRARSLSPLDPHAYFYDIMGAAAHQLNGNLEKARILAERSISENPRHTSSYRVLAITLQKMGLTAEASDAIAKMRRLEPDLTVEKYIASHPAGNLEQGKEWARHLEAAGLPKS